MAKMRAVAVAEPGGAFAWTFGTRAANCDGSFTSWEMRFA